jgi:hypothetical protein
MRLPARGAAPAFAPASLLVSMFAVRVRGMIGRSGSFVCKVATLIIAPKLLAVFTCKYALPSLPGRMTLSEPVVSHPQPEVNSLMSRLALPSFRITKMWLISSPLATSPKSKLANGSTALGAGVGAVDGDCACAAEKPRAMTRLAVAILINSLNARFILPASQIIALEW